MYTACLYSCYYYLLANLAVKVSSEKVDDGHSSVTSVDHKLPSTHTENDFNSQITKLKAMPIKPLSLIDPLKADSDEHIVHSSLSSSKSSTGSVSCVCVCVCVARTCVLCAYCV